MSKTTKVESPAQTYQPSRCNFIFMCQIAADGTFTLGPSGWTVEKTAAGTYRITHELGHRIYAVFPVPSGDATNQATLLDTDETGVTVLTSVAGTGTDAAFQLLLFAVQ